MRIALYQAQTGIDPAANGRDLVGAVEGAAAGGAAMLFTPEMSGLLDRDRFRGAQHLRPEGEDRVLAAVRAAAARTGIWVHLGSLALKRGAEAEDGKLANRGFVIDSAGAVKASYDKIHLFDVDLPTGESWRESASYAPGEGAVVVDTPAGPLGLAICYDLRFPDLFRSLTDAGAKILSVPAAFTVPTGKAHWHVLARARAIEAGVFVVAAAQGGRHEDGRETYGHSLVIDPWGEILLDMGDGTGLGFAEIDLARVDEVRSRLPAIAHRRPVPPVQRA
jgi:predicted amidohydrolase